MAKAKGTRVTKREVKKMYELYQEFGSFKLVAKKMRRDASTVSRHIAIYESALGVAHVLTQETKKEVNF